MDAEEHGSAKEHSEEEEEIMEVLILIGSMLLGLMMIGYGAAVFGVGFYLLLGGGL